MIEFTVILHNAVARKQYLTIQSATFTVDIYRFQTDWQLICTSKSIDTTEGIDYVIISILAMLQWAKVSFKTVLSTFYFYFASDDRKCINYCMHCRKLKCIHRYSCNSRLITFHYKCGSICKAFTNIHSIYICWDTSSIFLENKCSHTISWWESLEKLVRYTTNMQ